MKTAVVILNWNTRRFLKRFLPGVLEAAGYTREGSVWKTDGTTEVIVADNASSDDSVNVMATEFQGVRCTVLDRNYGFTGGYNLALGALEDEGFDYYVLLNSDIEVPEGWMEPLEQWMDTHPECGACAPKLHSYFDRNTFEYAGAAGGMIDPYGYTFCRGRIMGMVIDDDGRYDSPADVLWGSGACLMVRAQLYHELGGLDERFFAHMEEVDLCWRMQLKGWKVTVVPYSSVYHLGGGTLPQTSPKKLYLNFRNNLLLLENNLARTYSLGMGAEEALVKAGRMIAFRRALDLCSAAVYLFTLRPDCFKAVLQAHKDYKKLRIRPSAKELESYRETGYKVNGIYNKSIILRALLKRKGAFKGIE